MLALGLGGAQGTGFYPADSGTPPLWGSLLVSVCPGPGVPLVTLVLGVSVRVFPREVSGLREVECSPGAGRHSPLR